MDPPETSIHVDPEDALRRRTEAVASGLTVDIGGLATSLHASDTRRADAVAHLLADAMEHPGPPQIAVRFDSDPIELPTRPPDVEFTGMDVWYDDGRYVMKDESGVIGRADRESLVVGGDAPVLRSSFRRLFHVGMAHTLGYHARFVLHGGAMLGAGEGALLVLGGSRAGKSSLIAVGLHCGWPAICDDMMVLREGPTNLLVAGIPRPMTVPSELARELGITARQVARGRPRAELPRGQLRAGWWPVIGIVLAGHGSTEGGGLRTLGALEVLPALVGAVIPSPDPRLFPPL